MEKLTKTIVEEFIRINEIELAPTHGKLCIPIIQRIYRKMSAGIKFSGIKVENNIICDGHHRYIASLLANYSLERLPGKTTSATITTEWVSVSFQKEDWDTEAKIRMLNEQDAMFNNLSVDTITGLLK